MLDGITLLDTGTKVVSYTWGWSGAGAGVDLLQQYLQYFLLLCLLYV